MLLVIDAVYSELSEVVSEMLKERQEERIHLPATKVTSAARYSHRAEDNEEWWRCLAVTPPTNNSSNSYSNNLPNNCSN